MAGQLLIGCVVLHVVVLVAHCDFPFRNISLSWEERVNDLVGRLTLDEIVPQMARTQPAPAIDRLGIKAHDWDTECLRGDVSSGDATSFPQALGLAATFSPSIIFRVAEATSVEVRAKYNNYTKYDVHGYHKGISCFSPVINIMRHPLWGRNQETYGEDPFMNGLYAQHFVAGLQGDHPRYVRASAGCKHFDVHGGPDSYPVSRSSFDAKVATRDWRLTFLPAFRMCVEAGTYSVMCSYNRINGVPACANKKLLTDVLRGEWGFTGYVVSDEAAIENIVYAHHYLNTSVQTVAACLNAGCNLELAPAKNEDRDFFMDMAQAVQDGSLTMDTVIERVKPLFYTRLRQGEFDPPEMNPYNRINLTVIESEPHITLAREAAVKSFVLLKNNNNFLPINTPSQYEKVAIVGPMSDNPSQLFGDYAPNNPPGYTITPFHGLQSIWPTISMASGCSATACTDYNSGDVEKAINGSNIVFVCLGTGQSLEAEGHDRMNMDLPGSQLQLLQDAVKYANGAPVVLLMFNAGPLDIAWADQNEAVSSILACFFPAQETGNALQQVLLGDESPAGRLPYTWYRSADQIPEITNYTMAERTYRYFTGDPLYPFGYGLSYTNFTYTDITIGSSSIQAGEPQTVSVTLHNSGAAISDEVVQVYISWVSPSTTMPQLQLVGYDRLRQIGPVVTSLTVKFVIDPRQMAQWDDSKEQFFIESGEIRVYAGGQQPNQKRSVASNVLQGSFQVTGQKFMGRF
ncbi:xylan 1,4-beta-xylosidase-like [Liolophura sinensis]|uniref:xylan 1,4-beta-xylosidase-like n=1 Tax=Liolophura sinensis TaxID=3198878 RepID=UPI003157FA90